MRRDDRWLVTFATTLVCWLENRVVIVKVKVEVQQL